MGRLIDLAGQTFGRLDVLSRHGTDVTPAGTQIPTWECRCACGETLVVRGNSLRTGNTTSCGCYKRECDVAKTTKHGRFNTREYKSWQMMKDRCTNPKAGRAHRYQGRGITVDPRWMDSFENFYEDMGDRPPDTTLDRIDNNGPYTKANCRWADNATQAANRRYDDREVSC